MSQDTVVAPFRRCSALGRLDIPCTAAAAFVIETAAGNASFSCADIAHQAGAVRLTPWQEWFETFVLVKHRQDEKEIP